MKKIISNILFCAVALFAVAACSDPEAEKLEKIGAYAFVPYTEDSTQGASFETIYVPNLKIVGDGAFNGCSALNIKCLQGGQNRSKVRCICP